MPWWDTLEESTYNQQQSQAYFQSAQRLLARQQAEARQRAEQEAQARDHRGILGILGAAGGEALDTVGAGLTKAAGGAFEGLDWYDKNVVGNVWNNGMGRATAIALGREYDDDWKYENLSGWQRFGAGMVADPLNYLPIAGMATKSLKAATTSEGLLRALTAADKGIAAANKVQDLPFQLAGKGLKYGVGAPVAAGGRAIGHAITATDMGADIFRTLGRPTTSFLVREDANLARNSADYLLTKHATTKGLQNSAELTGDEAREFLFGTQRKVRQWDDDIANASRIADPDERTKAIEALNAAKPSWTERNVADNLSGGPATRNVTKRLWENFRRMATKSGVHTGSTDMDYVDDVLRAVSREEVDHGTAAGMLALHAGNDDVAMDLILKGTPLDTQHKDLIKWVSDFSGNRQKTISGFFEAGKGVNGKEVANDLAQAVGMQTQKDISSATRAARAYMNDVHFGPLQIQAGDILNRTWDPFYEKWWTQRIEKYVVNPFQQLVLGYAFFPLSNAMEEIAQNMIGGNTSYKNWSMGLDEFYSIYSHMGPRFELPPSLLDGVGDKDRLSKMLLGEAAADGRELAMLGGQGMKVSDRGAKGLVTGGMPLRLSNLWSGNARRAFVMNKFSQYLDGSMPELFDLGKEGRVLSKHGWDKRVNLELKMGAVLAAQGKSPEEVGMLLHNNWRGPHQDLKKFESTINQMGFHPETQEFLLRNLDGLANPASRDDFLAQAFDRYTAEATVHSENLSGLVDEWSSGVLDDLDSADATDLVAMLHQAENARLVIDRTYAHSRKQGFGLDRISEEAGHKFNREALPNLDERFSTFNERYEEIHRRIANRLKSEGVLTPEGRAGITKIGETVTKRGDILRQRAKELRSVNTKSLKGKPMAKLSGEEVSRWRDAQQAVYDKYQPRIDAIEDQLRAINGPRPSWFPATKNATNAHYIADHLVRASDIPEEVQEKATQGVFKALMNGEDPYDAIASYTKFPDEFEVPAQGFAGHEYSFPGDAGEQLPLPETFPEVPLGPAFQPQAGPPNPNPYNDIVGDFKSRIGKESGTIPGGQPSSGGAPPPAPTPSAPLQDSGPFPLTGTMNIYQQYEKRVDIGAEQVINRRAEEIRKLPGFTGTIQDALGIADEEMAQGKLTYEALPQVQERANDLAQYTSPNSAPEGTPRTGILSYDSAMKDALDKAKTVDYQLEKEGINPATATPEQRKAAAERSVKSRRATPKESEEMRSPGRRREWYASEPEPGVKSELISEPGELPVYKMTSRPKTVGGVMPQFDDPFVFTKSQSGIVEKHYKSEMEFDAQESIADATQRKVEGRKPGPSHANPATEEEYAAQLIDELQALPKDKQRQYLERLDHYDLQLIDDELAARESGVYRPSEPATDPILKGFENQPEPYFPNTANEPYKAQPSTKPTNRPEPKVAEPYTPPSGARTVRQDDIVVGRGGRPRQKIEGEDGRYFYDENRAAPPAYESESDMGGMVHQEVQARSMARQAGISLEQARNHLWEESHMRRMLQDKEQSQDWLHRVGSIFRGVDNAPERNAFYEELADNFKGFVHQLDTAAEVSTRAPEVEKALDAVLKRYVKALSSADKAKVLGVSEEAWKRSLSEYHKYFTNYDDGKTVHMMMRHIFPFWRYEYQRFPRLARVARKAPYLMTNYYRFLEAGGDGTVQIPGTPVRINPLGGTLYNGMREILRDGGYSYNGKGGFWQRANETMKITGFIPGPVISGPDAYFSGTPGDQMPTAIKGPLDAARGFGPMVPIVGEPVSETAAKIEDTFDSRYRQYNINQVLAERGIHPYEATEEQKKSAAQAVARSSAIGATTGNVVQTNSQWTREQSKAQLEAARAAGIPEEALKQARRTHSNPLYAEGDEGRYLNVAERRAIEEEHPEWERLAAVRSAFKNPTELQYEGEKYRSRKTLDDMQKEAEEKLQPIYEAFARGEVSGRELLSQRKTVMDELRGAKKAHNAQFANPKKESDQTGIPREDLLAAAFYDIEPPTDANGMPDWDSADRLKAQFIRDNHVTKDELKYITDIYPRKKFEDPGMNQIESQYRTASDLRRQYYSIPKYEGMDQAQADLADKGIALVEEVRKGRPNLTTVQALAIVARYDAAAAQAARKALTIKSKQRKTGSARKTYWDANPLLEQFYGS